MKTRLFRLCLRLLALVAVLLIPWAATASAPLQQSSIGSASRPSAAAPDRAQAETALHNRPLLFVPNNGQFDTRVRFQLRGGGGMWWFTDDALWLTVVERPAKETGIQPPVPPGRRAKEVQPLRGVHLKLAFPGMNADARLVADDPQPSRMNYFLGNDAAKWRANVPTYGTLRWEGVYPGVNLVFGRGEVGMDVTVQAGPETELAAVQLRIEGADEVDVDAAGRLVADTSIGAIPLPALFTAEGISLEPHKEGDAFTFRTFSGSIAPFAVQAPTDDPSDLVYSTFLGGSSSDVGEGIALGPDGSIYVTGATASTDFPITPGAFQTTCQGNCLPTFVTRFSPDGATLIYSTYLGGGYADQSMDIEVGRDGSAYVAGFTYSPDFPTTPGAFDTSFNGSNSMADGFASKLDATGSTLLYSTFLGGVVTDLASGLAVGEDGTVYISGMTASFDFPTTPGAFDTTFNSSNIVYDGFVTKLNATGTALVYSTFLGGSQSEGVPNLALGADGSAYVTGDTTSEDFPTTPGAFDTSYNGGSETGDAFIAKLNATGSALVYSTFLGGSVSDRGAGIAVGANGEVVVEGHTSSPEFPVTPGAYDTTHNGSGDVFVTRLTADGSGLVYSTFLGGSGGENGPLGGGAMAFGEDGAVYVSGFTYSADFPTTLGAFDLTYAGGTCYGTPCRDAYLAKLDATGSSLLYSTYLGGGYSDLSYQNSVTVGADGSAYLTGLTFSNDFPMTPDAYDPTCTGCDPLSFIGDAFVARLSPDLVRLYVADISPTYRPRGSRYLVGARITIRDVNNTPVSDASVTVNITLPSGDTLIFSNTTNTSGRVIFRNLVRDTGTYTFTVTGVSKYGWLYDSSLNIETSDSITIP